MPATENRLRLVVLPVSAGLAVLAVGALTWVWGNATAAEPAVQWLITVLALGLLALAACTLLLLRRNDDAEAESRALRTRLQATLDILPDGLGIYDADDRLVAKNAAYGELAVGPSAPIALGMTIGEISHTAAASGVFTEALNDPQGWVRERLSWYRTPGAPPLVQAMQGDRWVRVREQPLKGGGMVILRTEVTEIVRQTRALEQALASAERAQRMLHEAIEAMPVGLELYDEQDRLVLYNQQQARMCAHVALPDSMGKTYEELLRLGLERGLPREAEGQEDLWLAHEMALRGHRHAPEVRQCDQGRWMHIHETRTPSGLTVSVRLDITDLIEQRQKAELARQENQRSRQLLERAMHALPVGIEIFDEQDRLVLYNQQLARMYPGLDYAPLVGKPFAQMLRQAITAGVVPQAEGREEAWISERLSEHGASTLSRVQKLPDGRWITLYETRTPENYVLSVRLDITDLIEQRKALESARQEAQSAHQRMQDAVEALPEGFALFDADDRLVLCNTQYRRVYSISSPMIQVGRTFEEIVRYGAERGQYADAIGNEQAWVQESVARHRSPKRASLQRLPDDRWVQVYESRTPEGGVAGVRIDVTQMVRKEQELAAANEQLARLSTTDGLTGLANRRHFDDRLQAEWQRGARRQQPLAVVLIDIDHFKRYNDHYGHVAGDECLRRVAQLLQAHARRTDEVVARYGGEEFVLLLRDTTAEQAQTLAEQCRHTLRMLGLPHAVSSTAEVLTLSAGVCAGVPDPQLNPLALLQGADAALYRAKEAGRNRVEVAEPLT